MRANRAFACAGALGALLAAAPAPAHRFGEQVEVYGYSQVWLTFWEQMEDAKGLYQYPSHDEAADALSGFGLAKARVGLRLSYPDWNLSLHAQARLDHDVGLLDAEVAWTPRRWLSLHLGQLKVPGSCEALADDRALDFILRSDIATAAADWSLAKAEHPVSLLYGSVSNLRDLGIALKGEVAGQRLTGRYFVMVGNGLGANLYFGGLTRKEYFITNKAQFYYGGRLELAIAQVAELGAFGSYNRHDNIVFNSGRAVYDIDRRMVGGDLRVAIAPAGLRFQALGAGGQIRDDFNGDGRIDLRYSGWAVSGIWDLRPAAERLAGWRPPEGHAFELGVRLDRLDEEVDQSGLTVRRNHLTFAATWAAGEHVKVQLDYVLRRTDDPAAVAPDLANDVLFANFQAAF